MAAVIMLQAMDSLHVCQMLMSKGPDLTDANKGAYLGSFRACMTYVEQLQKVQVSETYECAEKDMFNDQGLLPMQLQACRQALRKRAFSHLETQEVLSGIVHRLVKTRVMFDQAATDVIIAGYNHRLADLFQTLDAHYVLKSASASTTEGTSFAAFLNSVRMFGMIHERFRFRE